MCSSGIHILFCLRLLSPKAVRKFFLLPLCGMYTLFWGCLVGTFFVWLLLFMVYFLFRDLSNCWFFQARLLILLWWSILYEIAEVLYMFEYFLCVFPKSFNSNINSYVIIWFSLFLFIWHCCIQLSTGYVSLSRLFLHFKSVEHLWKILIGG